METGVYRLWAESEYNYPAAFGFVPNIVSYIHEGESKRLCMLVVPGGGYMSVSPTEAEITALKFYSMGYNCFVLSYTTNPLLTSPLKMQPLKDISRAVRYLRLNADKFKIDHTGVILCGFSAGGHLCAGLSVHFDDIADTEEAYSSFSNRPDASVLCYPVISSGKLGHAESFTALLGEDPDPEMLDYMSLEKHVTQNTPPCFLWHTAADELVPPENSIMFSEACRRAGVKQALHIFSEGEHGLSLADEDWAAGRWGDDYTLAQIKKVLEAVERNEIALSTKAFEIVEYFKNLNFELYNRRMNKEVALWPVLADVWISAIFNQ